MGSDEEVKPIWTDGVPFCTESCPSHDGKRCEKLGFTAPNYCEPAIVEMAELLKELQAKSK